VHAGALLAPLGVRFVVSEGGDLPSRVEALLDAQVDLDRLGTTGLVIYRNAVALPPAGVLPSARGNRGIVASASLGAIARLSEVRAARLVAVPGGWAGVAPSAGIAVVSSELGSGWRLEAGGGARAQAREAFGWAMSFDAPAGAVRVRFGGQWVRTLETIALGLLWAAALWVTRKPVGR